MSHEPIVACPRCGQRRPIRAGRVSTGLCRDCWQTEPDWPNVRIPQPRATPRFPADQRAILYAAIEAIAVATRATVAAQRRAAFRYCCAACGCLLLPAEDCIGCRVAAMNESEVA